MTSKDAIAMKLMSDALDELIGCAGSILANMPRRVVSDGDDELDRLCWRDLSDAIALGKGALLMAAGEIEKARTIERVS